MDNIIDGFKDVLKEDADLTAFESKLRALNPLSGLETKEAAWDLIKKNPMLISTFDQKQNERAVTVEENLMNGKVQEILKTKEAAIREELMPNETEAQIARREFKEYKTAQESKETLSIIQNKLLEKANEIGFDPIFARELAIYGDNAEGKLDSYNDFIIKEVEKRLAEELKSRYPGESQPKGSTPVTGLSEMTDTQLNELVKTSPAQKTAVLEEIKRRMKPTA